MLDVHQIKPLTDFLRHSKVHIEDLKRTGAPELLTVNGEAAVVVQDAAAYQELVRLAEQARDDARLINALEALRKGEQGVSLAEAEARLLGRRSGR